MARGMSATRSSESAEASPHPINRLLVGGKLVGNRPKPLPNHRFDGAHGTFEPIITPEVSIDSYMNPPVENIHYIKKQFAFIDDEE